MMVGSPTPRDPCRYVTLGQSMTHRFRQPTIFEWIAIIAGALVVLRMLFPALVFDNQSLILLCIAALSVALPRLLELLPPLKRLKYGKFEAEFNEAIDRLEERVNEAEEKPAPQTPQKTVTGYPPLHDEYVKGFKEILSSRTSNTEKILAAAILAESMLAETAKELQLTNDGRFRSPSEIVRLLASNGFISDAERDAFNGFWQIRNTVVHRRSGGAANRRANSSRLRFALAACSHPRLMESDIIWRCSRPSRYWLLGVHSFFWRRPLLSCVVRCAELASVAPTDAPNRILLARFGHIDRCLMTSRLEVFSRRRRSGQIVAF